MYLEECTSSMNDIVSNSELLVACYYIIESAVSYMASDRLRQLDRKQRDQVDFVMEPWIWLNFHGVSLLVSVICCHQKCLLNDSQISRQLLPRHSCHQPRSDGRLQHQTLLVRYHQSSRCLALWGNLYNARGGLHHSALYCDNGSWNFWGPKNRHVEDVTGKSRLQQLHPGNCSN